jgi:hypothetical protein
MTGVRGEDEVRPAASPPERPRNLGVDVKVILTPPGIFFFMENHQ